MDNKLFEAACTGNIGALHKLLQENPLILAEFAMISPHENPLHIAAKAGQHVIVREVLKQKPELAREVNSDGFRPMDIASAMGYVEIVRELLTAGLEVCRLKGRDGRTALHYAAINGRVEIIDELISTCSESIKDVTSLGETALHLAVKYYKFEAFRTMVQWLERLGLEYYVNWLDREGNTVLHLAVSKKQLQSVELLLSSGLLELNAMNTRGLTAMDVLDILPESPSDVQLREILRRAGALTARDLNAMSSLPPSPLQVIPNNQTEQDSKDWFKYFRFHLQRDSPSDTRNALLVVAALIATVTFQAGVNPPSSFLQQKTQSNSTTTQSNSPAPAPAPEPWSAPWPSPNWVPASRNPAGVIGLAALFANLGHLTTSTWFLFGNTLSLAASLSIIIYLTAGFPFQRELQISIYSMMFSYGYSIRDIRPNGAIQDILLGIAFLLPFSLRWPPRWVKKAWKWWKKLSTDQASRAPMMVYLLSFGIKLKKICIKSS